MRHLCVGFNLAWMIKQPSLHHSIFPFYSEWERTGNHSHSLAKGPEQTMCSVMNALTSVQLSMAQYVAVFTCESKHRFDQQTSHPLPLGNWYMYGRTCNVRLHEQSDSWHLWKKVTKVGVISLKMVRFSVSESFWSVLRKRSVLKWKGWGLYVLLWNRPNSWTMKLSLIH